ncbi:MAG: hypothetical protein EPN22_02705 [Nitrospirae bacterium]|nr:MAG: hypothetical protein EPN22_02705 [Nitrospirota bacterium]
MDTLMNVYNFISDKDFSVPLGQIIILVILNSGCLLLGKYKLGLLISYLFVFYWGFSLNRAEFINILGQTHFGLYIYALSGIAMLVAAVIGFFQKGYID